MNPIQSNRIATRRIEDLRELHEDFLEEGDQDTVEAFYAYVSEEAKYSKYTREECQQVYTEK